MKNNLFTEIDIAGTSDKISDAIIYSHIKQFLKQYFETSGMSIDEFICKSYNSYTIIINRINYIHITVSDNYKLTVSCQPFKYLDFCNKLFTEFETLVTVEKFIVDNVLLYYSLYSESEDTCSEYLCKNMPKIIALRGIEECDTIHIREATVNSIDNLVDMLNSLFKNNSHIDKIYVDKKDLNVNNICGKKMSLKQFFDEYIYNFNETVPEMNKLLLHLNPEDKHSNDQVFYRENFI